LKIHCLRAFLSVNEDVGTFSSITLLTDCKPFIKKTKLYGPRNYYQGDFLRGSKRYSFGISARWKGIKAAEHCLFHKMFNLRAKCPRSEWPLIKAKILKITIILKNLLNLILLALIYELMLTSLLANMTPFLSNYNPAISF